MCPEVTVTDTSQRRDPLDLKASPRADTNCPGSTGPLHYELTIIWCFRWSLHAIWQKSHGTDCLDTQHAMLWLVPNWCPVAEGANSNDVITTYNSPPSPTCQSSLLVQTRIHSSAHLEKMVLQMHLYWLYFLLSPKQIHHVPQARLWVLFLHREI